MAAGETRRRRKLSTQNPPRRQSTLTDCEHRGSMKTRASASEDLDDVNALAGPVEAYIVGLDPKSLSRLDCALLC